VVPTTVDRLGVLTSVRSVVEHSRYVRVDEAAISSLAPGLVRHVQPPAWDAARHHVESGDRGANWLLVLDAINFSFWGTPRWTVEYRGERLDGYWALAAALSRAVDEGVPIGDADYLAALTMDQLAHVLRGSGTIPMLDRRLEHLNQVGDVLRENYDGAFARVIESAAGSASRLVRTLVADFPAFDDVADYRGVEVRFYKRAQLLVSDLYGAYGGEGLGRFTDLDHLTAFADYKLPQVLRHMGILTYRESLAEKVDHRFLFPPGSQEEVEIRAGTIWAIELTRQALASFGSPIRAFELDWWLWHEAQRLAGAMAPYHLVRTVAY
jgi:hypothetical protein